MWEMKSFAIDADIRTDRCGFTTSIKPGVGPETMVSTR
jgi:hypothetical protein